MSDKKLKKGFIQTGIPIVLFILLLIGIIFLLFRALISKKPSPSVSLSPEEIIEKTISQPLAERTKQAYEKIKLELPYQDPEGKFTINYLPAPNMFDVDTKATTWEEYAERSRKSVQFFRSRGIDPCGGKIFVNWGADLALINVPMPEGLDFGCPVNLGNI